MDSYRQFDADRKVAWMNKEAAKRGYSNATNWQNADAQGFQTADAQYRQEFPTESMPQQIPREAQGMPDVAASSRGDGIVTTDPISAAAVREKDGKVFTGPLHTTAIEKAIEAGYKSGGYPDGDYGFVTKSGRFLSSQEARDYAIAQGQVTRQGIAKWEGELGIDGMPGLESGAFALAKSEAKKFKRFDEDFRKAATRGDEAAAQKINDQAAKELGLKPVIHATSAESFTEFKIHPEGDIQHGFPAIFFSDKDMGFGRHREAKGKRRVEKFYIRMERPLDLRKYKSDTEHPAYQKAYDQYAKVFDKAIEQGRVTEDSITLGPLLNELPFDSLLLDEAQGFSYAVLDPSQVVSARPILLGADGAPVLPSQRFASALATKNTIAKQSSAAPRGQAMPDAGVSSKGTVASSQMTRIYHGTSAQAAKVIARAGFDVSSAADGTIWFTTDKSAIESGNVAATGKGAIVERLLDENRLKLGGWNETDKFSTDQLIAQGYDGLRLEDGGEVTFQIFFPEKLVAPKRNK
jgi:hypothetical protein